MWYKIIVEKYGASFSNWVLGRVNSPHGVSCWRTIADLNCWISSNSNLSLHSGSQISFWHDKWVGDSNLEVQFPLLHKLDRLQNDSIAAHFSEDGAWKFDFKRVLLNLEVDQLATMFLIIGSSPPTLDVLPDTRRWALDSSGVYTVKSLYAKLVADAGIDNFPWKFVWQSCIPPKVCFLMWCAVHGKLNSLEMLNRKGMELYNSCILCGDSEESQDHILIHCKVARCVWNALTPNNNWAWVNPESMYALVVSWPANYISGNAGKDIWNLLPAAIVWTLRSERNYRTFQDKYNFKTDVELCYNAKALVLSWVVAAGRRIHCNFSHTVLNWDTVVTT